MSRQLPMVGAINEALHVAMASDPDVIVLGEDVAGGGGRQDEGIDEAWGGIMGATKGLIKRFGPSRVRDTPISEMGFVGAAVGAAVTGLRPVVELMFIDFIGVAFDPLLNQAAKLRYMFGGKARVPLTVRTSVGAGLRSAAQHSQSLYNLTTAIPGLKTVIPSNPADAKGLLLAAIRDDDPVIFCEPKSLMFKTGEVAEGDYTVPLGTAAVARTGSDLSLVAFGAMVDVALAAAAALAEDGVSAEVLDLRSLQPLDEAAILATLAKTGRLIVIDEAPPRCGIASDVAALCVDAGFDSLNGPVRRVTAPHAPVPFSAVLEDAYRPTAARVVAVARELLGVSTPAVPIGMPKLGMTMTEGRVVAWPRPLGSQVAKGEIVLVIESEKAEVEIEAPAAGYLRHVYVEADRTVPCGTLLAALTAVADEPFDVEAFRREHDRPERAAPTVAPAPGGSSPTVAALSGGAAPVTPAARALAKQRGIDVAKVAGTGPQGRVTREDVEAYVAARERLVPVGGGVSLEVLVQGKGDAVVLIPGFGSDLSMFSLLVPALAASHRVVGVNPRGIGLSEAPNAPGYDLATVAREVLAAAGERAHFVGASLGAAVAIEAALAAPERVRSLTLITPFIEADARLLAVIDGWCRVAAEASPAALAAMLLPWLFSIEYLRDARVRARTLRGLTEMVGRVPAAALSRYAAGLQAWSGTRRGPLSELTLPTLVVAGAEDLLTPDTRDVADAIPGARFVAVGGAGHGVALEAPDAVGSAVAGFLRAC